MTAEPRRRVAPGAERDGKFLARAAKPALRRAPLFPRRIVEMELPIRERGNVGNGGRTRRLIRRRVWHCRLLAIEVADLDHPEVFSRRPEPPFVRVGII